ncbi:MAG TPA: response regulator transcription factor [Candidatus Sulfotelmatobacter sp.]|nr:response regulator transcription factor [Candidatus Sulfotelmatobacter sp.]
MPTIKKTNHYRSQSLQPPAHPCKVETVSLASRTEEALPKEERSNKQSLSSKSQGRLALSYQEQPLLAGSGQQTHKGPITLMVADDHPVVREGLVTMIERQLNMQVVAQASNGQEAVDKFLTSRPDVGLLDLRMPVMNGADAVMAIREKEPAARLIILTTYQGQEDIYRALRAGAMGYLLKDAPPEDLIDCIRAVSGGRTWIPPAVGAMLAKRVTNRDLTAREKEVLGILSIGKSNKEIGVACNISEATVKVHVTHILEKLKVCGRTEAINVAVRRGLVIIDSSTTAA